MRHCRAAKRRFGVKMVRKERRGAAEKSAAQAGHDAVMQLALVVAHIEGGEIG